MTDLNTVQCAKLKRGEIYRLYRIVQDDFATTYLRPNAESSFTLKRIAIHIRLTVSYTISVHIYHGGGGHCSNLNGFLHASRITNRVTHMAEHWAFWASIRMLVCLIPTVAKQFSNTSCLLCIQI